MGVGLTARASCVALTRVAGHLDCGVGSHVLIHEILPVAKCRLVIVLADLILYTERITMTNNIIYAVQISVLDTTTRNSDQKQSFVSPTHDHYLKNEPHNSPSGNTSAFRGKVVYYIPR